MICQPFIGQIHKGQVDYAVNNQSFTIKLDLLAASSLDAAISMLAISVNKPNNMDR